MTDGHGNQDTEDGRKIPTAAIAEICETCGHIELVHTNTDQPFRDKDEPCWSDEDYESELSDFELVRREDHEQAMEEQRQQVLDLIDQEFILPLRAEIARIKAGHHTLENPETVIKIHEINLENYQELKKMVTEP